MDQSNTNNLLQLARRLHEEHVREGMEKRDQLIAEGHATAARIVSEAETGQRATIEALEQQKAGLERSVEELRIFESEYREQLKGYIESQLRELNAAAPIAAPEPAVAAPVYGGSAAPVFEAPGYQAPVVEQPIAEQPVQDYGQPQAEYAAPEYQAPTYADYAQEPAPQPTVSVPPAYAGFPAPVLNGEFPAPQAASQEPQPGDYPTYQQRHSEYPGVGGN